MLRKIFVVLLLPLILVVSACAQIPRTSDVNLGPDLDPQNVSEPIYYSPSGPLAGASQEQVVSGFITAGTGPQNDYLIARDYLTNSFRAKWSPYDEVLVQQGAVKVNISSNQTATVTVNVQGRVDADGILHNFAKPITRQLTYQLVHENLEWRIASGPNVTILNKPVFDVLFSGYSLYFFDKTHQYLVPELRWLPARASTATRLVNALLDGPSAWLNPALDLPVPADVKLAIQAVTVQNGVAMVNLNGKANSLDADALRMFKTQAEVTLKQLPAVSSVSLFIDGVPKQVVGLSYSQPPTAGAGVVTLSSSQLSYFAGAPIQGAQVIVNNSSPSDFAINLSTREFAIVTNLGLQWAKLGQIDRKYETLLYGDAILSPIFDRTGMIWAVSSSGQTPLKVVTRGTSNVVKADWLSNYDRLSFSVSQEGSRVTVVASTRSGNRLFIAAIIRDSKGLPIALGEPTEFAPAIGKPMFASWIGKNELAVAYQHKSQDPLSVYRAVIGGSTESFGSVSSVQSLFANSIGTAIYALTKDKVLYENLGYGFNVVGSNIFAAHTPQ